MDVIWYLLSERLGSVYTINTSVFQILECFRRMLISFSIMHMVLYVGSADGVRSLKVLISKDQGNKNADDKRHTP